MVKMNGVGSTLYIAIQVFDVLQLCMRTCVVGRDAARHSVFLASCVNPKHTATLKPAKTSNASNLLAASSSS